MHSTRLRSLIGLLALFGLLLATAVSANVTPVAAAQGSVASKVPALVQARVAEIQAAHRAGRSAKPLPRGASSLGLIDVSTAGALDLQIHALSPVSTAEEQQLRDLGATVASRLSPGPGTPGTAQAAVIRATVPFDRVDAVAALPWVAAIRPTIRGSPM